MKLSFDVKNKFQPDPFIFEDEGKLYKNCIFMSQRDKAWKLTPLTTSLMSGNLRAW